MSLSIQTNKEEDLVRFSNSPSIPLFHCKLYFYRYEDKNKF